MSQSAILVEVTGDKAIERKLSRLSCNARSKVARPAVRSMLSVIARAEKAAAPTPELKRTIGTRLDSKGGDARAKVGAGVGKARGKKKVPNRKGRPGVGLSASNVHWFILGTQRRETGSTTRAPGRRGEKVSTGNPVHNRGQIRPQKFIRQAAEGAWPAAVEAARQTAQKKLAEEAAKS